MDTAAIIAAIGGLTGVGGFIATLLLYRANRRKINAEANESEASAAEKVSNLAADWMERFSKRMECAEKDIADLKDKNEHLKKLVEAALRRIEVLMKGIKVLIEQLECNHIQPAWRPDEWSPEDIKG